MAQCFRFYGKGTDNNNYEFFACGTTPEYRTRNSSTVYLYLDGVNIAGINYFYTTATAQVVAVPNDNATVGYTKFGNCTACNAIPYDCINGACIPKSTYNTPGFYATISDCEIACGKGCSGKCLSNKDWAKIEDLGKRLKNQDCK
jgi:hypothetical protein